MNRNLPLALGTSLLAALVCVTAEAKVSQQEAEKLKGELTPMGAERAGNQNGNIPAWEGGLRTPPPCFKGAGSRYCDPFSADQPLFTITAQNLAEYQDQLSAGQLAMLRKYGSYKLNVYPTRRTAAYPDFVYEATYKNALNAELASNGESTSGAIIGPPFPIPKNAIEVIINHKVRYRGERLRRVVSSTAVTTDGNYTVGKLQEDLYLKYNAKGANLEKWDNIIINFLQVVLQPPRLAGSIILVHESLDQITYPRRAWQYNPSQKRLRRAPLVGYDNPGTASDGLRTNDQQDTYNGATDRYTWKLLGKREMFIPYNAYKIHSDQYKIADIVKKGHINQDLARYERHRVWVVEANLKESVAHMYARRVFYVDEDTWQIVLVDVYDRRGELWRWQEAHTYMAYDKPHPALPAVETCYDIQSSRYLAFNMNNEDEEIKEMEFSPSYFEPGSVQKQAIK